MAYLIDICIPVVTSAMHLTRCLESIEANTDLLLVPTSKKMRRRYIICDDAGAKDVLEAIRSFAKERDSYNFIAIRNEKKLYFTRSVNRCLALSTAEYAAVIHPGCILSDAGWLDKLIQPFNKDPRAALSGVDIDAAWTQEYPFKMTPKDKPLSRELFLYPKRARKIYGQLPEEDPLDPMEGMMKQIWGSGNVWMVRSIKATASLPDELCSVKEKDLDRRAIANPTVLLNR